MVRSWAWVGIAASSLLTLLLFLVVPSWSIMTWGSANLKLECLPAIEVKLSQLAGQRTAPMNKCVKVIPLASCLPLLRGVPSSQSGKSPTCSMDSLIKEVSVNKIMLSLFSMMIKVFLVLSKRWLGIPTMNAFLLLEEVTETRLFACTTSKKAMKFNTR